MQTTCEERSQLDAYLDHVIAPDRRKALAVHVRDCAWCLNELSRACTFTHKLELSRPRRKTFGDLFSPVKNWFQNVFRGPKPGPEITPPAFHVAAEYREVLLREARRIVATDDEAEDVVQGLVLRALRTPLDISPGGKLPWLFTCLRYVAFSYLEGFGLHPRTPLPPLKQGDFVEFTAWGRKVFHKRIGEVLEKLDQKHATLVDRYYLQGYDVAGGASKLGISLEEGQALLAEARRILRQQVEAVEAQLWALDFQEDGDGAIDEIEEAEAAGLLDSDDEVEDAIAALGDELNEVGEAAAGSDTDTELVPIPPEELDADVDEEPTDAEASDAEAGSEGGSETAAEAAAKQDRAGAEGEADADMDSDAADSEADSDSDSEAQAEADSEAQAEADSDSVSDAQAEADSEADSDSDSQADSDAQAEDESEADSEAEAGDESEADFEAEPEADSESDAQAEEDSDTADSDSASDAQAEADADSDSEPDSDSNAQAEANSDSKAMAESDSDSDADADSDSEAEAPADSPDADAASAEEDADATKAAEASADASEPVADEDASSEPDNDAADEPSRD